jgi:hypothetical protein
MIYSDIVNSQNLTSTDKLSDIELGINPEESREIQAQIDELSRKNRISMGVMD